MLTCFVAFFAFVALLSLAAFGLIAAVLLEALVGFAGLLPVISLCCETNACPEEAEPRFLGTLVLGVVFGSLETACGFVALLTSLETACGFVALLTSWPCFAFA